MATSTHNVRNFVCVVETWGLASLAFFFCCGEWLSSNFSVCVCMLDLCIVSSGRKRKEGGETDRLWGGWMVDRYKCRGKRK